MGIENKISTMAPKKRKLIENIISVAIIFIIVFAFLQFVSIYQSGGDIFSFLNAGVLMPIILPLIFLYFFGYRLIRGGKLNVPKQQQSEQKKTEFNIPNVWGDVAGIKKPQGQKQFNIPNEWGGTGFKKPESTYHTGSWRCPKCGNLIVGNKCYLCREDK